MEKQSSKGKTLLKFSRENYFNNIKARISSQNDENLKSSCLIPFYNHCRGIIF